VSTAMVARQFRPSRSIEASDLLILVTWGSTLEEGKGMISMRNRSPGGKVIRKQRWVPYLVYNAALMGMVDELFNKDQLNTQLQEVVRMSSEHRYFTIVSAFDNRWYQRTGDLKCLWTTRLSAYGGNLSFAEALPAMVSVGSDYFGSNLDGFSIKRSEIKAWVEMPEIQIIEYDAETGP
jgi:hypothetical protein